MSCSNLSRCSFICCDAAAAWALTLAKPASASFNAAFVRCSSAEASRRKAATVRARSASDASRALTVRSNCRTSSTTADRLSSRPACFFRSSSCCSRSRGNSPSTQSCRNCANSRSTSAFIFAARSYWAFHMSASRCRASRARWRCAKVSFAAWTSPAFKPRLSSRALMRLARSACSVRKACDCSSTLFSNISRQSFKSRSLALCASRR
mmetsp:Transcript_124423/g.265156  ORF Transcript_124423/g.265156 Transcript_124423/m.265156 type:complete len:209 (+) Transcript_124423:879-1505(+)